MTTLAVWRWRPVLLALGRVEYRAKRPSRTARIPCPYVRPAPVADSDKWEYGVYNGTAHERHGTTRLLPDAKRKAEALL